MNINFRGSYSTQHNLVRKEKNRLEIVWWNLEIFSSVLVDTLLCAIEEIEICLIKSPKSIRICEIQIYIMDICSVLIKFFVTYSPIS